MSLKLRGGEQGDSGAYSAPYSHTALCRAGALEKGFYVYRELGALGNPH